MRSRSPEEEVADSGVLPGGRGGDSGADAAPRSAGEPAYPMSYIGAGEGLRPFEPPTAGEFPPGSPSPPSRRFGEASDHNGEGSAL